VEDAALKYWDEIAAKSERDEKVVKIIMTLGIFLMLLQAIATFFKDIAKARGEKI
jgi:hypothetical protein